MLKVCTIALLCMVLLYVTSLFTCIFSVVVAGILFAIFNDFQGKINILNHFVQNIKQFLWTIRHKGVPTTNKFATTYKDSFWDMDKFNKSPSGSFYNWSEKSECFSPLYTSRLLPKYRTFAKATSTPLNSPKASPPPPERQRYSFTKNHQARNYGDNNYEASPKSASRSWSNLNLSTYADSRSYGLASRIVDYNAREEERDNRSTYKAQRAFPIVRLFKKELPVISAKPNTVTVHIAQPDSANYEAEQRKLILQSIMQEKQPRPVENTETRSVLDALKEISRKRIHPENDLNITQNGTSSSGDSFNYPTNSKRTKEDLSLQEICSVTKKSSEKKIIDPDIPYVDPITASLTSSDKDFERELLGKKRKAKRDSYEAQKSSKVQKLHSVETQTTNELLPEQLIDSQTPIDIEMENSKEDSPETVTKQQNQPLKVFDDKPLEINRKKRLALILGALSGEAPDFGNSERTSETHSILSPTNKSKQEKHVTFNETVEIRKIVSDDDLSTSKSQQKAPFSESTHTSISTFTSLNTPTTSSTAVSPSNQATTTPTFSLPNPVLSSTVNSLQKPSQIDQFKIQDNSKPEFGSQTKTNSQVDQPPSPKPGGFKFDLKTPASQPQTNFFSPAVNSSSDSSILQFKGPTNVTISNQNSASVSSTPSAPTFQFSGTTFGSTATTTPPKLTTGEKTEIAKSCTPPKSEAGLNFNFQPGGTQKLGTPSTSNMPSVTFTPPSTTKPIQFAMTTTTSSVVSPFGGTSFGKSPSKSSLFEKDVTSTVSPSLFKSNNTTASSSPFALPTTSSAPTLPPSFGATSSATVSPFGTSTTTVTTKSPPPFASFTTQSYTAPSTTGVTPSFGFGSSTSAPTSSTAAKPGTFSFASGSSTATFGTDKTSSFSFGGGSSVTTTTISSNTSTSIAPPAFGIVSTTPNIFGNAISSPSAAFKSTPGTVSFGNVTTTPATTSSFGTQAVTTSSTFGSNPFGNGAAGTGFTSGSKFSQPGFGSLNPTTTFSSTTQSLPTFGTSNQPRSNFDSSTTSAFAPNSTHSSAFSSPSTFGANTAFGTNSQPGSTFGSNTNAFGTSQPATSSVFGSSFGSGTSAPSPAAPTFGSTAPQTSAPTFGNSNATPTFGSSTFGATTFGPNTTQTGFGSNVTSGFGSTNTQAAFGSAPQPAFGAASAQSGFGSTTQSAFGSAPQSSFGASTTQPSGFGSSTQQPFGSSAPQLSFGGTAPPPFGTSGQSAFGASTQPQPFSFGGSSGVAASGPSSGVFSFGSTNDPNKPVPNFSSGSNFGTLQQPYSVPNFNAPAPGMFSIGSGGSNTAKSRSGRPRRRL